MKTIGIPQAVATQYWHEPFSELERLAGLGVDGICDADVRDREIWDQELATGMITYPPGTSPHYEGLRSYAGRKRMHGYAILYRGDPDDYRRDDVAALYSQNW
jgi:hypothetical protein